MRRIALLLALGAVAAAPPAAADARAKVRVMVVGKSAVLAGPQRVALKARTARVAGKRCSIGRATPLSVLAGTGVPFRLQDYGACSAGRATPARSTSAGSAPTARAGTDGWVYKVGRRAGSGGAADPGRLVRHRAAAARGPAGALVLVRQGRRRLLPADARGHARAHARGAGRGALVTVRGYDDSGAGVPVEGAVVNLGESTALTGAGRRRDRDGARGRRPPAAGRPSPAASSRSPCG